MPGEEYKPHFDFGGPCDFLENLHIGRRHVTMLVYLNDVEAAAEAGGAEGAPGARADDEEEGAVAPRGAGETVFPELRMHVTPRLGTALVFNDCLDDGSSDKRTLHGGEPPVGGAYKYAINVWIRANSYQRGGRRGEAEEADGEDAVARWAAMGAEADEDEPGAADDDGGFDEDRAGIDDEFGGLAAAGASQAHGERASTVRGSAEAHHRPWWRPKLW